MSDVLRSRPLLFLIALLTGLVLAGCGDDEVADPTVPLVGEIDDAIAAVDA